MERRGTLSFPDFLGSFDSRTTPVLRTDVLVIGGGLSGATAALAAADAGAAVLLLTKNPLTESNTAYAQGGLAVVLGDDDSLDLHVADTLRVGAGLADPAVVRAIVHQARPVLDWLLELGMRFDQDANGGYLLSREGGHSVSRVIHNGDSTGVEMQRALTERLAAHPRITCRTQAFVQDLFVHEGRCAGALAIIDGSMLAVEANATIVATGGAGQIYRETTNPIGACGDGAALCFRAGARLADMEFVQFHPTTLYIAGASRVLVSEVVRGAGAVLRDRNGVRFMPDVHPDADLAPRDVVSRAILERMVQTGDTHVYLDLSALRVDPHRAFPFISRICAAFDIDIARDAIPVRPGAHYMIGGVATDLRGHSDVPGLFAVGEAGSTGLHGANRLASNSLLECAVLGRAAGSAAAASGASAGLPRRREAAAPAENAPRIHLEDLLYSLKSLMWRQVGLLRTERGLDEAMHRIGLWHHYLMRAGRQGRQPSELADMLTVAGLVAVAAKERRESRGTHHDVDVPQRNDADWCRRIFLQRRSDGSVAVVHGPLQQPSDEATR